MSSEDVTFQRIDHTESLIQVFERLLESSSLVDCTIAADGQYLKAHRIILSACSPFFQVLFDQESDKNPIVILKDTKFEDLKAVIDFVYRGQVKIPEFRLNSFVNTVESLQIQGICRDDTYKYMEQRKNELPVHGNGGYPCPNATSLNTFENAPQQFCAVGESEPDDMQNQLPPSSAQSDSQGESLLSVEHSVMKTEIFLPDGESLDEPTDEVYVEETPIWESDEGNGAEQIIADVDNQATANQYANFPLPHEGTDVTRTFLMPQVGEPVFGQDAATVGQEEYTAERLMAPSMAQNVQLYLCNKCHKSFTEKSSLYMHQCTYDEEPTYPCVVCHKLFLDKNKLIRHQRIHTGLRPHSCSECHKSFKLRHHLTRHQLSHTVKRLSSSVESQKLITQLNQASIIDERSYSCADCPKSFPDANTLKIHKRIHTGERPYSCGECHKTFTQKSHLTRHQRVHTGQRPYLCTYCHKSFADTSVLLKHKRIHTGERPYVCPVCHKSFVQKVSLNMHLRIHARERPYSCDECHRSFAERSMLIRHQLVHTGQPHYPSSECHKSFTDKSSLIIHKGTHSGDSTHMPSATNYSNEEVS